MYFFMNRARMVYQKRHITMRIERTRLRRAAHTLKGHAQIGPLPMGKVMLHGPAILVIVGGRSPLRSS